MTPTKPYRRYRARGGKQGEEGLAELQALNSGLATAPKKADARPKAVPADAATRHWWSLRGIGVGGWAWRIGLLLVVGLGVWVGLGFMAVNNAVKHANSLISPSAEAALSDPPGGMLSSPQNTLIIGSDARRGQTRARADSILIMRTDPGAGRIKWMSIPRDFRVTIGRLGDQKINAAFYYGGQRGMIRAVQQLTGLPIHHIVVVNFRGFPKLVDELGGVTVKNPSAISNCPYPGGTTVSFPKGDVTLSGERALQFVRVRKCDDDFRRAARQQAFVAALRSEIVSFTSLPRAPWRGAAAIRTIGTDMGTFDLIKLGWLQMRLDQRPSDRFVLAGSPRYIDGQSFVVPERDLDERQMIRFVGRR